MLNYNEIYLDGKKITIAELKQRIDEPKEMEVIELVDIDCNENLYFETNIYGTYY